MSGLPPLREEIQLLPAASAADGSPVWTLYDPSRNRFFRLNWMAFEILARWDDGDARHIAGAVCRETTLAITPEDVHSLLQFFLHNHLLQSSVRQDVARLHQARLAQRRSWGGWLLHHYLFFRVPLVNPDAFLNRMIPRGQWFFSRAFLRLTLVAGLVGLVLAMRQWEVFLTTLWDNVSMTGMVHFALALTVAKVVHELGHALAAKRFGCRVPTMGLAFMVLWPVLYTDTNDSWKLSCRRQRMVVGGAGMMAELAIAAYATLAWALLPDSGLRQMAFILATTTWISTLLVNLSPFMRFDGYFLLMDGLDLPNLHGRAFAMATWFLRERLFGLDRPPPEYLAPGLRRFVIFFAFLTWIYRLVVFFGIALMVYEYFFKLLGLFLFMVEVAWFIVLPIRSELTVWWRMRQEIVARPKSRRSLLVALLLLVLLFIPWQSRLTLPALMQAREQVSLYAPAAGRLVTLVNSEGRQVVAGETLMALDAPDLDYRLAQVNSRIRLLEWEISAMGFEAAFRKRVQSLEQEMQGAVAERLGLQQERQRLQLRAPLDGQLRDLPPELRPGAWIAHKEYLGSVVSRQGAVVVAYVPEADIARIHHNARALFHPDNPEQPASAARVIRMDPLAAAILEYPHLATLYGGNVPVREYEQLLFPDGAFYRLHLLAAATAAPPRQTVGTVTIDAEQQSIGMRFIQAMLAVVLREGGF